MNDNETIKSTESRHESHKASVCVNKLPRIVFSDFLLHTFVACCRSCWRQNAGQRKEDASTRRCCGTAVIYCLWHLGEDVGQLLLIFNTLTPPLIICAINILWHISRCFDEGVDWFSFSLSSSSLRPRKRRLLS